ncbi:hypothetical protein NDU88_000675 [Pleurodeles waltl]|uniref:Uncharacterized protein n=1 Tax=Pleurodeles waltl TaxID=8319 RepID=A0AAV7TFP4_PLEWA|nr:hypothetical protein NDU88_000675 [Pleurodeles waltl]
MELVNPLNLPHERADGEVPRGHFSKRHAIAMELKETERRCMRHHRGVRRERRHGRREGSWLHRGKRGKRAGKKRQGGDRGALHTKRSDRRKTATKFSVGTRQPATSPEGRGWSRYGPVYRPGARFGHK